MGDRHAPQAWHGAEASARCADDAALEPPSNSHSYPLPLRYDGVERMSGRGLPPDSVMIDHPDPPHLDDPRSDRRRLRRAFSISLAFVALLWTVHLLDVLFGLELFRWGVLPRDLAGLVGIVTGPLVHGSWTHLFANTLPLIVLGTALIYGYPRAARIALPILWLGSGIGVWLFARPSFHIGASGIAHGIMFFVFLMGVLRRDRRAIGLSLTVFFLYGGMVATILPQDPTVSFEAHLAGAIIGVGLALWLRDRDPRPPAKKYSWELEAEIEAEPDPSATPEDGPEQRTLH